jgi:hypothetical protein
VAISSKLIDQLPQCAGAVAEVLGDILLRAAVEEHGAEGLVAAMIWMRGPGEELAVGSVVHHRCSLRLSVGFLRQAEGSDYSPLAVNPRESRRNHGRIALVITTAPILDLTYDGTEGGKPTDNDLGNPLQITVQADQNVSQFSPPRKSALN